MSKPLSPGRVRFLRGFFVAALVKQIALAVAGIVLFRLWWTVGWILIPAFQFAILSPLHRSQILGRHDPL